jgi:hypothetical protein
MMESPEEGTGGKSPLESTTGINQATEGDQFRLTVVRLTGRSLSPSRLPITLKEQCTPDARVLSRIRSQPVALPQLLISSMDNEFRDSENPVGRTPWHRSRLQELPGTDCKDYRTKPDKPEAAKQATGQTVAQSVYLQLMHGSHTT